MTLMQGEPILFLEPAEVDGDEAEEETPSISTTSAPISPKLIARHAMTLDENRPAAVERRRKTNQRTARENIAAPGRCRLASSNTARWRSPPSAAGASSTT